MTAWVFVAAPKLRPLAGIPPMTPGSAVSVMRSSDFLFVGDCSYALGHADP